MSSPDLEKDLYTSTELLNKVQSLSYAQNLYAALCNHDWQKREVFPILCDYVWYASWRTVGGIVARLRNNGEDYMSFYCTGVQNDDDLLKAGFVTEGTITDEIRADLDKLNWFPVDDEDNT